MFTKIYNMYKDKSEKEFKYKKENVINELLKISFKLKNLIKNNNKNIDEYRYLIDCKKYKNQELKELNYALRNIKNKKFEETTNAQQFQFLPNSIQLFKISNKYINEITFSKNIINNEIFGIYINLYYNFSDNSKLRKELYITVEHEKKNLNWYFKNIYLENIKSNLKLNPNHKIELEGNIFKYKKFKSYNILDVIRFILYT